MKKPKPLARLDHGHLFGQDSKTVEINNLNHRVKYLEEMVEWLTLNITPPDKREYASPYDPAGLAKQVRKVRGE